MSDANPLEDGTTFATCTKCKMKVVRISNGTLCVDCTPKPQKLKMSEGYNDGRRP